MWEGGVFSPDVLKITDEILMEKFSAGVGNVAALSLGADYPTEASLPHMVRAQRAASAYSRCQWGSPA